MELKKVEPTVISKFLSTDTLVCSYPKSGTTWLQWTVFLLMSPEPLKGLLTNAVPSVQLERKKSTLNLFKTHYHASKYPDTRMIYIVRDPLDVCVSQFHHLKTPGVTMAQHVDLFCQGKAGRFGGWVEHVKDGLSNSGLILRYEDMLLDRSIETDKIAQYLNIELSSERLASIVSQTSFEAMRKDGDKLAPALGKAFFRVGKSGSSLQEMTEEQRQQVLTYIGDLKESGVYGKI